MTNKVTCSDCSIEWKGMCPFCKKEYVAPSEPKTKYYFWLGVRTGYVWSCTLNYFPPKKLNERLKYMGFTYDIGWPKKMNTGRLIHKPSSKTMNKQRKLR